MTAITGPPSSERPTWRTLDPALREELEKPPRLNPRMLPDSLLRVVGVIQESERHSYAIVGRPVPPTGVEIFTEAHDSGRDLYAAIDDRLIVYRRRIRDPRTGLFRDLTDFDGLSKGDTEALKRYLAHPVPLTGKRPIRLGGCCWKAPGGKPTLGSKARNLGRRWRSTPTRRRS